MVPSGPPTPVGGSQSVPPALLRVSSGMLGAQGGPLTSQTVLPSLMSPHSQFNNMNTPGNMANVSALLNQSFGNGVPSSGLSGPGSGQHGGIDAGTGADPLAAVGNNMDFNNASSFVPSNSANPSFFGQLQNQQFSNSLGNQGIPEQRQPQQVSPQSFQQCQPQMQQFSASCSNQQQQFQSVNVGLTGVGPVKSESHVNDQQGLPQLQSLRTVGPVKSEPQQFQSTRSLLPAKMEPQHSDQSMFLQQQQLLSRQSSQAAAAQMNLLHNQRLLQLQQQNQQQLPRTLSQQRPPLQQQSQQQNISVRSPVKPVYEPGTCARRLTHYMYHQQHRPEDNNIEFWRKFVAEYFAPKAKKKWCVSMYGGGRQATGVFPQDLWHCEICNRRPGRGFEATVEVLPRLFKIKYESGTLEELLYVDMPREYQNSSGQIILDYAKAIQESIFEQLRVVREGQLRIVFSPDLKICSWEFCARRHEELIPRRTLIPQVSHLAAAAQRYQASTQNASSNTSSPDLQSNCNMFVSSARQLAKSLEVPLVNDLGYTKRYVRCLQIAEVVNCMKDLIDYSHKSRTGPMESLAKLPHRTKASSGSHGQPQQSDEQPQHQQQPQRQQVAQNLHSDQSSTMQLSSSNFVVNINTASTSTLGSTTVGLLHQNSVNSRQHTPANSASSLYGGSNVQAPSPPSSTMPQMQANSNTLHPPTPSSSNNPPQPPHNGLMNGNHMTSTNSPANTSIQQPSPSGEADQSESQNSVQKIIHDLMMSGQFNGTTGSVGSGPLGNGVKNFNGAPPTSNNTGLNSSNCLNGNGMANGNSGIGAAGYGAMGGGVGQSVMVNGISNNSVMNGRVGIGTVKREPGMNNQQDLSNQLLNGFRAINGFNSLQFD